MKKRILSLVLILTMLTSMCVFLSLNVSAATGEDVVNEAMKYINTPTWYNYGGEGDPGSSEGVDCSGLTLRVFGNLGYSLKRSAAEQATDDRYPYVNKNDLQIGDLVCFKDDAGKYSHVGIYIGNDNVIDAPKPGEKVRIGTKISTWYKNTHLSHGRRIIASNSSSSSHTCSGGKYLWYWSAHPHYNCYSCATCGKEWANKNETNYIASCSECNPPKQSATTTVSKWVTCKTKIKIPAGSPKTWIYRVPESDTVSNKTWDCFNTRTEDINFTSQKYAVLSNGKVRYQINVTANGENITAYINATDVQVVNTYHTTSSTNYDSSHPHKKYAVCECGQKTYTGETKKVDGCNECYPKVEETKPMYYTITYNANGGSGAPSSETIPNYDGADESVKISSKEPTRSGYVFLGWSTNSQASSADYEGGDRYNITKDTTFYAVWEEDEEEEQAVYSGNCGKRMYWEYNPDEKLLTINGRGEMYDYYNGSGDFLPSERPWLPFEEELEKLIVEDGVESIGWNAFNGFSNLEYVELPESLETICRGAFSKCENIYKVIYDGTEDEFDDVFIGSDNEAIEENIEFNYYTQEGFDFDTKVNNDADKIILTIGKKEALVFGKTVTNDVAPIIRNGRTMLPARFVAEALGATVEWNEEDEDVVITYNGIEMCIGVNETKVYFFKLGIMGGFTDCWQEYLDVSPFIENSRTFLPVRFIAEQLDADVEWNEKEQQVIITKN